MTDEGLAARELQDEIERLRAVIAQAADDVRTLPRNVVALNLRRALVDERKGYRWSSDEIIAAIRQWHAEHGEPPTSSKWSPKHLRDKGQEDDIVTFMAGHYPTEATVRRFFGTFPKAVIAAGFEPATIGRPKGIIAPGLDDRWPQWRGWEYVGGFRVRGGLSMKELAERTHISYGHLRSLEQGANTNPTIRVVLALSQGLRVRPSALLGE